MANKTVISKKDPIEFIKNLDDSSQKKDSIQLIEFLKDLTGWQPMLWGKNMIGFGKYHYEYKSGRSGESFVVGFSPRKNKFSFYTTLYLDGY